MSNNYPNEWCNPRYPPPRPSFFQGVYHNPQNLPPPHIGHIPLRPCIPPMHFQHHAYPPPPPPPRFVANEHVRLYQRPPWEQYDFTVANFNMEIANASYHQGRQDYNDHYGDRRNDGPPDYHHHLQAYREQRSNAHHKEYTHPESRYSPYNKSPDKRRSDEDKRKAAEKCESIEGSDKSTRSKKLEPSKVIKVAADSSTSSKDPLVSDSEQSKNVPVPEIEPKSCNQSSRASQGKNQHLIYITTSNDNNNEDESSLNLCEEAEENEAQSLDTQAPDCYEEDKSEQSNSEVDECQGSQTANESLEGETSTREDVPQQNSPAQSESNSEEVEESTASEDFEQQDGSVPLTNDSECELVSTTTQVIGECEESAAVHQEENIKELGQSEVEDHETSETFVQSEDQSIVLEQESHNGLISLNISACDVGKTSDWQNDNESKAATKESDTMDTAEQGEKSPGDQQCSRKLFRLNISKDVEKRKIDLNSRDNKEVVTPIDELELEGIGNCVTVDVVINKLLKSKQQEDISETNNSIEVDQGEVVGEIAEESSATEPMEIDLCDEPQSSSESSVCKLPFLEEEITQSGNVGATDSIIEEGGSSNLAIDERENEQESSDIVCSQKTEEGVDWEQFDRNMEELNDCISEESSEDTNVTLSQASASSSLGETGVCPNINLYKYTMEPLEEEPSVEQPQDTTIAGVKLNLTRLSIGENEIVIDQETIDKIVSLIPPDIFNQTQKESENDQLLENQPEEPLGQSNGEINKENALPDLPQQSANTLDNFANVGTLRDVTNNISNDETNSEKLNNGKMSESGNETSILKSLLNSPVKSSADVIAKPGDNASTIGPKRAMPRITSEITLIDHQIEDLMWPKQVNKDITEQNENDSVAKESFGVTPMSSESIVDHGDSLQAKFCESASNAVKENQETVINPVVQNSNVERLKMIIKHPERKTTSIRRMDVDDKTKDEIFKAQLGLLEFFGNFEPENCKTDQPKDSTGEELMSDSTALEMSEIKVYKTLHSEKPITDEQRPLLQAVYFNDTCKYYMDPFKKDVPTNSCLECFFESDEET